MNKLSKRAISILVIAIFLMSMIPFMPVSAAALSVNVSGYPTITDYPWDTDIDVSLTGTGKVTWSDVPVYSGAKSYRLETLGNAGAGDEARIIIFPSGLTLGDIDTISWMIYTIAGYPAHIDITLDVDGDSVIDPEDMLTAELAVNNPAYDVPAGLWPPVPLPTYGAWVKTFEMSSGDGYSVIDDTTVFWVMKMGAGDLDAPSSTLGHWKAGVVDGDPETEMGTSIPSSTTPVVMLEIEVDNWIVVSDAYIDDIRLNGVLYHFEAEGVDKGDTLTVYGAGVTSGSVVNLYWDYVTSAGLVNNTMANPDGTYEVELDVPSGLAGAHYIWIKDVETGTTLMYGHPIFVLPKISLSPSSGLVDDEITMKGYGFSEESDVTFTFHGTALTTSPSTVETDEDGYFKCTFDVPDHDYQPDYLVVATDESGWTDTAEFDIGASISLTPDEGPTGTVVTVEGRGWTDDSVISFTMDSTMVEVVDDDDEITVASDGTFEAEIVILGVASEDEYTIEASELPKVYGPATADFDVTGIAEIVVSPTYGTPGATITVKGYNFTQIAGTDVTIILWDKDADPEKKAADLVIAETKSDGTFEDTFISPAVTFTTYDVIAEDDYHIDADDAFKVGLIALIINPIYGEAGTDISITGIGFAEGDYNVTFGTKLYEEYGTVSSGDAISDHFWVPNFEPGTYDVTVTDTDDNELTVQFSLTESTYVIIDPAVAPNDYNVSIKGYNFADIVSDVDFVIYNVTADGEVDRDWDMDVRTMTDSTSAPTATDKDGNFTGFWYVLDEDTLSFGDYTINVTGSKGLLVQVPFSIVAARVSVAPRKAQFDRGDMIQFDIKNDFILENSYIKIYDPYNTLYWSTDKFADTWWLSVEGLYTVPYYRQTAALNPMELQSDAPTGAWLYIFYDVDDEQLMNGTFAVGPSTGAQVEERLAELWDSMEDLADSIASSDDNTEDLIDALSDEFSDKVADIEGMIDDITADLAEELAGVAEDTEAAVGELEGAIGDIAVAQSELADEIEDMGSDTAAAKKAAEDAQKGTQGLTTIVYGAIACSLIAALAAVISLMQITKKIA